MNQVTPGPWSESLREFIRHPVGMIGTDSTFVGDKPSPRTYGSFPRVLGQFVREEALISLEEAVRSMTSAAAARIGLRRPRPHPGRFRGRHRRARSRPRALQRHVRRAAPVPRRDRLGRGRRRGRRRAWRAHRRPIWTGLALGPIICPRVHHGTMPEPVGARSTWRRYLPSAADVVALALQALLDELNALQTPHFERMASVEADWSTRVVAAESEAMTVLAAAERLDLFESATQRLAAVSMTPRAPATGPRRSLCRAGRAHRQRSPSARHVPHPVRGVGGRPGRLGRLIGNRPRRRGASPHRMTSPAHTVS